MFMLIEGVGLMGTRQFRRWLRMVKVVGHHGAVKPPPFLEDRQPDADVPELSPEAEQAGLRCVAEALFKKLRADGKFRRVEERIGEMDRLLSSTRALLQEGTGA